MSKAAIDSEHPLIAQNVNEQLSTLLKKCWDENPKARPSCKEIITCLDMYSHDVFKTNDKEVQMRLMNHDNNYGCTIS